MMNEERLYEPIWSKLKRFPGYYANIYGDVISMKSYKSEELCRTMTVYGKNKKYVRLQNCYSESEKVYIDDIITEVNNNKYKESFKVMDKRSRGQRNIKGFRKNPRVNLFEKFRKEKENSNIPNE